MSRLIHWKGLSFVHILYFTFTVARSMEQRTIRSGMHGANPNISNVHGSRMQGPSEFKHLDNKLI
jgi:hypothetical protein